MKDEERWQKNWLLGLEKSSSQNRRPRNIFDENVSFKDMLESLDEDQLNVLFEYEEEI